MKLLRNVAFWFGSLFWFVIFRIVTSQCEARSGAPRWWTVALASPGSQLDVRSIACSRIPGLSPKQLRFCLNNNELMTSIATGTKMGIQQCKHQFKNRRWNCNTLPTRHSRAHRRRGVFGSLLEAASREAAFVHAVTAAGVAYSVTKSCANGSLQSCGCDRRPHERPDAITESEDWRWGLCNENIDFGVRVSREFVDARDQSTNARGIMNLHNYEAGRQALRRKKKFKCKCHGVSGSCELETCWFALPDFNDVGNELKRLYLDASKMKVDKLQEARGCVETLSPKYDFFDPPSTNDLVYFDNSHNFCNKNATLGIEGTRGRVCNATSGGIDGCDLLCCGRGYNTRHKTQIKNCHCEFKWCCNVTCQECTTHYKEHTCK